MRLLRLGVLIVAMGLSAGLSLSWAQEGAVRTAATRNDAATAAGHSHTTGATITLTPTAGQYVYVTGLDIQNCANGSAVTAAAPTYITTTNITGAPQYQIGSGVAAGLCQPVAIPEFTAPLRAAAVTTAVTFVLPSFATNQVLSVNVYWYSAP